MSAAYYNEIDRQKAAWLRELISRNLIATGDVDERSIADVRPDDLQPYRQCHFFAGIGIWSYALRAAGWPDDREVWTGSCPCQPFSDAGKKEAFNDERHLWPVWFPLIAARRPVVCFGEQVASVDGLTWLDVVQVDLDRADYSLGCVDLCAAGVGAPHQRQRLYWVAHTAEVGCSGRPRPQHHQQGEQRRSTAPDGCGVGVLGLTEGEGPQARIGGDVQPGANGGTRALFEQTGAACDLADATSGGCGEFRDAALAGSSGHYDGGSIVGPVNGFWQGADWVLTRPQRVGDRPGLRPVEPRSFPLAHGTSARLGRLRGYGDGIVAPAAVAFIQAANEVICDMGRL